MSSERREFVNLAIDSAFGALELILNDADMRRAVVGVPLYLLTTIAYACVFLMKAQTQWGSANLNIRYENVASIMDGVVVLLEESSPCSRHVAHSLGRGLTGMLSKFNEHNTTEKAQFQSGLPSTQVFADRGVWPDWGSWMFSATQMPAPQPGLDQDQLYGLSFLDALSSQMPG